MRLTLPVISQRATLLLRAKGHDAIATRSASRCAWLEATGYPGLKLLAEALNDQQSTATLTRDALGMDLQNVSCVFLASAVGDVVREHGRVFLRNVRHGLYLLPDSVEGNYAIGCPIDPSFPLGGNRTKNPYAEKLAAADSDGVEVDESLWQSLAL
jgi:hypothetical protein